jgi:hypothetical protein
MQTIYNITIKRKGSKERSKDEGFTSIMIVTRISKLQALEG